MAVQYGQTWWGTQWLAAFNGIDYGNRLPRGRRYAGNGSVSGIGFQGATIRANVQGRRSAPYTVKIHLPTFSKQQQTSILTAVSQSPAILARLLNRQLPAQMLTLMDDHNIPLFPKSWGDMKASCSCPDWAIPCKHIAAVIYLVANEIDKNPFLVFQLHHMNLAKAIEKQTGVAIQEMSSPPQLSAAWQKAPVAQHKALPEQPVFESFDLTTIPDLGDRILGILSEKPLFYHKDFRQVLADFYKRTARVARQFEKTADSSDENTIEVATFSLTQLIVGASGRFLSVQGMSPEQSLHQRDEWLAMLARLRCTLSPAEARDFHQALMWQLLYRLAVKLVVQRACIPAVFMEADDYTLVHWQPALLDRSVKQILEQLYSLCPPDLVVSRYALQNRKQPQCQYADGKTQVNTALNVIIGFFMEQAMDAAPAQLLEEEICRLFFTNSACLFNQFETVVYPKVIRHWLRRLTLGERKHRLHLLVEELTGRNEAHRDSGLLGIDLRIELDHRIFSLGDLSKDNTLSEAKVSVLADLALLADYFPDIERLYQTTSVNEQLTYSLQAFTPFFLDILPSLKMLGIQLTLPKSLRNLIYPKLSLSLSVSNQSASVSYLNLDELLHFNWQVALGDQRISISKFQQLLKGASGLIRFQDQYVMLDDNKLQQLLRKLSRLPKSLSRIQLLQAGLSGHLDGADVDLSDSARQLFERLFQTTPEPEPEGLRADLRPYQKRGFEWLAQNARVGFGSLLADDMGLGKTLQVITLLLRQKETGQLARHKALVVAPTSLLTNWRKEIERFAPTLKVQVYHGNQRSLDTAHDVILTSYGVVRSDSTTLGKPHWRTLVIDEAQNIKNPDSQQAKATKKLKADNCIGLSGTPVENRLREYWSVFDFTNKGYLGTRKKFQETLASPIEKDRDQACLERFRKLTGPFILRRLKSDKSIIDDLPDKVESDRYCTLSTEQASLYQSMVDTIMADLKSSDTDIERRGIIFKLINALKQICNTPAQFLNHDQARIEESGKLSMFVEIMQEVLYANEKVLIFTQYASMGKLLVDSLKQKFSIDVPFFHGGLSRKKRDELVDRFQHDPRVRAMVLSLKAGGTGLNLTAASQVIHYDLWWNPAVEAQATDRAYRIGQKQAVQVHRFIVENTFEEKINAMIQGKKDLANLTVTSGEQWITELTDKEIQALVALE